MKPALPKLKEAFLNKEFGVHAVRVLKASHNGNSLHAGYHHGENGTAQARQKPEVRLVGSGPDYCDLEVTCGCGEKNQIRCWNMISVDEKKVDA